MVPFPEEVEMHPFTPASQQVTLPVQPAAAGQRPGIAGAPRPFLPDTLRTIRSAQNGAGQKARQVTLLRDDPAKSDVMSLLAQNRDLLYPGLGAGAAGLTPPYLKHPSVSFWTVRENGTLLGCGALKELTPPVPGSGTTGLCGEITSMRTAAYARGLGVGQVLLQQIISNASARGYACLLLETGTQDFFASSRRLYQRHGFVDCRPFGTYRADPGSIFMRLDLQPAASAAGAEAETADAAAAPAAREHAKPGTLTAILAAQRAMAARPPVR